jgi:hypothetical protein
MNDAIVARDEELTAIEAFLDRPPGGLRGRR